MIVVTEMSTDKPRQIDIQMSGASSGGGNYAMRVLKHHNKTGNLSVTVGVSYGAKQLAVVKELENQVKLIEDTVGCMPVQVTVVRQYREY